MKTRILQMLFIFSGLIFGSCTTDPTELITPEVVAEAENPDYEIIRSLGFSTKDTIDIGDSYVVEGDVTVTLLPEPVLTASALHGMPGDEITISAAYSPYAELYEWQASGDIVPLLSMPTTNSITITLTRPATGTGGEISTLNEAVVSCRYRYNGTYSAWTTIRIAVDYQKIL